MCVYVYIHIVCRHIYLCMYTYTHREKDISGSGLLNLRTVDILDRLTLCWGRGCCPFHCRVLISIPDLYPLDASSTPLDCDYQKCLQTLTYMSHPGAKIASG